MGDLKRARGTPALTPLSAADQSACYVIGAGFSKATAFEMPTADGFLEADCSVDIVDDTGKRVHAALTSLLPEMPSFFERLEAHYGALRNVNLEAVMTDLYVRAFGIGRGWARAGLPPVLSLDGLFSEGDQQGGVIHLEPRPTLSELAADYDRLLRYISLRLQPRPVDCPRTRQLVGSLKGQDSIISLNYDTIIERFLREACPHVKSQPPRLRFIQTMLGPPGFMIGGPESLFTELRHSRNDTFLKLHGSIDWFTCSNQDCPHSAYIQPSNIRESEPWYNSWLRVSTDSRCAICGQAPQAVIIPPVATKTFERFPQLSLMWLGAYYALVRSCRWTFIGVSVARTDFHLGALFRAASRDSPYFGKNTNECGQICIVNDGYDRAEDVSGRLVESLSPDHRRIVAEKENAIVLFESLDAYLHAVAERDSARAEAAQIEPT